MKGTGCHSPEIDCPNLPSKNQNLALIQALRKCLTFALLAVHATAFGQSYVTQIAAGQNHSLYLKSDGSLWAMGYNLYCQLGDGTFNNTNKPEQIVASGVTAIAAGYDHSLFLKSDGSLWAMGYNNYGQCGVTASINTNKPVQIVASGVTAVAAGGYFSLFLKSDGSLWALGQNSFGQLGNGTYNSTNRPQQSIATGVTAIAAGGGQSLFLKTDGSLWTMGFNYYGQLGDGTYSTNSPFGVANPEQIASGVTAMAAGDYHSLFAKSDGSLWVTGWNQWGQLGDGTFNNTNQPEQIVASGVTAVAAASRYSLFLESDGSLWGMGYDYYGDLGDGTFATNSPYGTNTPEQIVASGVSAVAAGGTHSLFLKFDGSLWGMGETGSGQLGDGFIETGFPPGMPTPEQIFPPPQPVLAQALVFQTNLQFSATCGFGGNFYLLASTNLTQPAGQWTPVSTNVITSRYTNVFSATLTNALSSAGQQFYILQSH